MVVTEQTPNTYTITNPDTNTYTNTNISNPAAVVVETVGQNFVGQNFVEPVEAVSQNAVEPVTTPQVNINVAPTYEETFMQEVEQINHSQEKRKRNPPRRLIEEDQCNFTESLLADVAEPRTYKQASNDSNLHSAQWKEAMNTEFASLMKNDTWELVPRPADTNVVGCKWVYKVKRGANGEIERFKSRLVAQGFSQTEGVDFTEVYAPVARFPTIRTL